MFIVQDRPFAAVLGAFAVLILLALGQAMVTHDRIDGVAAPQVAEADATDCGADPLGPGSEPAPGCTASIASVPRGWL